MSENNFNTINYFELPSDNTEQLKNFYNRVFNWKFKEGKDTPDYLYTESAGIKGALLKRRSAEQSAPTLFIQVDSIDDCLSKAKTEGGKVVIDKQEIPEGIFVIIKDPQQNTIGIWQSK
jgi:predicted enzyme related to lactoylglutathione lyase